MALSDFVASRLSRPAGRVLDAPIRDIIHEILKEAGYASPAEIQALRDTLKDMKGQLDALERKAATLTASLEQANKQLENFPSLVEERLVPIEARLTVLPASVETRLEDIEARLNAPPAPPVVLPEADAMVVSEAPETPSTDSIAEIHAEAASVDAASIAQAMTTETAPLSAAAPADCKVAGCDQPVRARGFCSPHYQQWRRGTLKGFIPGDGTILVDGQSISLGTERAASAYEVRDGEIWIDGVPVS